MRQTVDRQLPHEAHGDEAIEPALSQDGTAPRLEQQHSSGSFINERSIGRSDEVVAREASGP